jgi:hypothetical protein
MNSRRRIAFMKDSRQGIVAGETSVAEVASSHHSKLRRSTSERGQNLPDFGVACASALHPIASRIATAKISREEGIPSDVGCAPDFDQIARARNFRSVPEANIWRLLI